ncbi:MAG: hypothetical protein NC033_02105 [Clostridiales bacterium]|nr:hypothetical protein [Clostridiales bacterium]
MEKDIKAEMQDDIRGADYISPAVLLKMIKSLLAEEVGAVYRFERDGLKVSFINGQKFRVKVEEIRK